MSKNGRKLPIGRTNTNTTSDNKSIDNSMQNKVNVMEVMGLSLDDNVVEVDKLKGMLHQAKEQGKASGQHRKARSLNKIGVWEEMEQLYKELETKEKDYQVAMGIGKMLLEKNRDLSDQKELLKQQYEEALQQRDSQITELLQMVEKYTEKKQELQNEIKSLRKQVGVLQSGTESSESRVSDMYNEYQKLDEKVTKYKHQLRMLKSRNKELDDEVERFKSEVDQMKSNERQLKKQLKDNMVMSQVSATVEKSREEFVTYDKRNVEEELRTLKTAYQKLECIMDDVSADNLKLREQLEIREQEKEVIVQERDMLMRANQMLQEQEEESRRLLEDKLNTIAALQTQMEEQVILGSSPAENTGVDLQRELAEIVVRKPTPLHSRPSSLDLLSPQPSYTNLLSAATSFTSLDSFRRSTLSSSSTTSPESLETSEAAVAELKSIRKQKAEEHAAISFVYELRDRLVDSEIRNITRSMPNVYYFDDVLRISNNIIDSVVKDARRRILEKRPDNDVTRTIADLIFEICRLRRVVNDYSEAINQGTIDKLEKFKSPDMTNSSKPEEKMWLGFFNFFSGWTSP